ncbi:MAG TPA: hypothetical protein DIT28_04470 [Oxalobacteraceae bacterium]|jgi:uncharacterized protein YecT (DUF1311 family)|nr:hypothetical protein [Oxalobacteraceae bacterium]HCN88419.1 hypothetical protein [Oxalobacteraceae bacterium]
MNVLRNLTAAALLGACLYASVAAADPIASARSKNETSAEGNIQQVIIVGKRLNAAEKARMAQEKNSPKKNKMVSKKSPRNAAGFTHHVS